MSSDKRGINKNTFAKVTISSKLIQLQYYDLPGFILERLFNTLDKEKTGFLAQDEFSEGLLTLFTGNFEKLCETTFNIYDFDKDGIINIDDISLVLSYIPLKTINEINSTKLKYERISDFEDQIEAQKEISTIIFESFKGEKQSMNLTEYKKTIQEENSEFFIYVT